MIIRQACVASSAVAVGTMAATLGCWHWFWAMRPATRAALSGSGCRGSRSRGLVCSGILFFVLCSF